MSLSPATLLGIDPDIVAGDVEGEIVALRASSDAYLHLNATGSYIFEQLRSRAMTLSELCVVVRQRYDVGEEAGEKEVAAFVARCLELGLIREESL